MVMTAPVSRLSLLSDKDRPKEFEISYKTTRHEFSSTGSSVDLYVISFAANVAASVVANALCALVKKHSKGKSKEMTLDRKTILVEEGQITKVIEEHITRKS
jgi:hypothetical protein